MDTVQFNYTLILKVHEHQSLWTVCMVQMLEMSQNCSMHTSDICTLKANVKKVLKNYKKKTKPSRNRSDKVEEIKSNNISDSLQSGKGNVLIHDYGQRTVQTMPPKMLTAIFLAKHLTTNGLKPTQSRPKMTIYVIRFVTFTGRIHILLACPGTDCWYTHQWQQIQVNSKHLTQLHTSHQLLQLIWTITLCCQ